MLPIDRERRRHLCRSEMRCERERQTQFRGERGPKEAGPQNPEGHVQALSWHRMNGLPCFCGLKVVHQFNDILGELIDIG